MINTVTSTVTKDVRLPVALVGAGAMGTNHARVLADSREARLALVVDPDPVRARVLADKAGCPWATDVADLHGSRAAVIATPPATHCGLAVDLMRRGVPVLVEKPLSGDLEEVREILRVAEETGVPMTGGFVERFNPVVRTAQSLLDADPVHVLAVRHSPPDARAVASVVDDLLIHDVDLALRLLHAEEVAEVSGSTWSPPGRDVPEIADATLRFTGGALATVSASRAGQRKVRTLSIVTPTQLVELDLLRQDITVYRHLAHSGGQGYRAETSIDLPFVRQAGEPLALQLRHFVALVLGEADADRERRSLLGPHLVTHRLRAA